MADTFLNKRTIPVNWKALEYFTRDELRDYARALDPEVPLGRNKADVIANLAACGKAKMIVQLHL
jgi:hypothetical protein